MLGRDGNLHIHGGVGGSGGRGAGPNITVGSQNYVVQNIVIRPDSTKRVKDIVMRPNSINEIYALIIGVDEYGTNTNLPDLAGAVGKTQLFQTFLTSDLEVPKNNIQVLSNAQATCATILSIFEAHFLNNKRIVFNQNQNQAMIFFFAGRASSVTATQDGHRRVDALCAHDKSLPLHILAKNLKKLASKHGNNITVILDLCLHDRAAETTARSGPDPHAADVTANTQLDDLWNTDSHVVLAAEEGPNFGLFTQSLIPALVTAVKEEWTYSELIENLISTVGSTRVQYCSGVHKERVVFTTNPRATWTDNHEQPDGSRYHSWKTARSLTVVVDNDNVKSEAQKLAIAATAQIQNSVHWEEIYFESHSVKQEDGSFRDEINKPGARVISHKYQITFRLYSKTPSSDRIDYWLYITQHSAHLSDEVLRSLLPNAHGLATISRWDPGHLRGLGPISIFPGGFCQVRWP